MTAEWKKSAIERAKRKNALADALKELQLLRDSLKDRNAALDYYKRDNEQLREELVIADKYSRRYDSLRMKGVLIDHGGEFKFLQGDDLDAFFDGPKVSRPLIEQTIRDMAMGLINNTFVREYGIWPQHQKR